MASADALERSEPLKPKKPQETIKPEEPEDRKVHEITESSSDESGDEFPAKTRADAAPDEHKQPVDPALAKQIRDGAFIPEPEAFYATKNVADMHYLFTNDKLKEQPPALVLRSDPFCIPRVTDNVPNYRPMLNPLSIFMGEEKLLPGNFRLDPSERPPNASTGKQDAPHRRPLPHPLGSSSASAAPFRGKTSAFMGTMPRQTEFAEIPVSEKLFQNHEVFRPSPPMRAPASPAKDRSADSLNRSASGKAEGNSEASTSSAVAANAVPFSDAMLLSSIQDTLDVGSSAMVANGSMTTITSDPSASAGFQIQPLQPLDAAADTLTNYLPGRSSTTDATRTMNEHYFDPPTPLNHANVSLGVSSGSGTFNSFLSSAVETPSIPYVNIFEDVQQSTPGIQSFTSSLSSISITTPTSATAGYPSAIMTPQGGATGASEGTPRRSGTKKPRSKNVFRPCSTPGCTKGARGKSGLCQKHGGGKRCAVPGCPKGAQGSSTMCLFHGGGYRCTVEGCNTGARGTSGLCAKHGGYKKGKVAKGKRGPDTNATATKRARTDEPMAK